MWTNYYHYAEPDCPHCKRNDTPRHIGKSSAGWCFSLHIYPEDGIHELTDWKRIWENGIIKNEYGDIIQVAEMVSIITERTWTGNKQSADWMRLNHATHGPNGLSRHTYRATAGDGTYDLCTGEFS